MALARRLPGEEKSHRPSKRAILIGTADWMATQEISRGGVKRLQEYITALGERPEDREETNRRRERSRRGDAAS